MSKNSTDRRVGSFSISRTVPSPLSSHARGSIASSPPMSDRIAFRMRTLCASVRRKDGSSVMSGIGCPMAGCTPSRSMERSSGDGGPLRTTRGLQFELVVASRCRQEVQETVDRRILPSISRHVIVLTRSPWQMWRQRVGARGDGDGSTALRRVVDHIGTEVAVRPRLHLVLRRGTVQRRTVAEPDPRALQLTSQQCRASRAGLPCTLASSASPEQRPLIVQSVQSWLRTRQRRLCSRRSCHRCCHHHSRTRAHKQTRPILYQAVFP